MNNASNIQIHRSGLSDTHLHKTRSADSLPIQEATSGNCSTQNSDEDSEQEEFVYPATAAPQTSSALAQHVAPLQRHPSPAQLESLYAAASSGDLSLLKKLFRNALQTGDVEAFALANDASSRTGLTALHAAASRGFLDVVKWCEAFSLIAYILVCSWKDDSGGRLRCYA